MTNRIAELRKLITAERVADGAHRQAPGPGKWAAWQCAEIDLRDAAAESLPALLDCAEALRDLLMDTQHANHECDDEVYCPVKNAEEALARLNGDDHDANV